MVWVIAYFLYIPVSTWLGLDTLRHKANTSQQPAPIATGSQECWGRDAITQLSRICLQNKKLLNNMVPDDTEQVCVPHVFLTGNAARNLEPGQTGITYMQILDYTVAF